jgi:hypothetical protein
MSLSISSLKDENFLFRRVVFLIIIFEISGSLSGPKSNRMINPIKRISIKPI